MPTSGLSARPTDPMVGRTGGCSMPCSANNLKAKLLRPVCNLDRSSTRMRLDFLAYLRCCGLLAWSPSNSNFTGVRGMWCRKGLWRGGGKGLVTRRWCWSGCLSPLPDAGFSCLPIGLLIARRRVGPPGLPGACLQRICNRLKLEKRGQTPLWVMRLR